ncbi:rCG55657 [Rattus norvegicus]|uniref:RCG55657 n=1 Tax=Rattus norvegicus TaxID=10116 RepID=A6JQK6_RAT|nr:rCG55657 [Rattus norvegicus]
MGFHWSKLKCEHSLSNPPHHTTPHHTPVELVSGPGWKTEYLRSSLIKTSPRD